ncbi:hypothetical protein [Leptospira sp. GIMC2001]|uniref:hypothetical protein n=1 Tax=Leptospira sp. GIMC2001 TaxID=1513297 RepID=UPI00234B1E68|nr:hypothetical protein [Leptospira sp. GIMC2001]WCL51008.1 hypothetical protein O4O04_09410 [Leptospira sp. GIMC2001]
MKIIFLILFLMVTINVGSCKTSENSLGNEHIVDKYMHIFKSLSNNEVKSITENVTLRHFDEEHHGNQIEYNSLDGKTYLWYPNNKLLVIGHFKIKENKIICFNYNGKVKNQLTGEIGGVWNCQEIVPYYNRIRERKKSNVFKFNDDKKVPYILNRYPEESIDSLVEKLEK